jgi:hypothetical protein
MVPLGPPAPDPLCDVVPPVPLGFGAVAGSPPLPFVPGILLTPPHAPAMSANASATTETDVIVRTLVAGSFMMQRPFTERSHHAGWLSAA